MELNLGLKLLLLFMITREVRYWD